MAEGVGEQTGEQTGHNSRAGETPGTDSASETTRAGEHSSHNDTKTESSSYILDEKTAADTSEASAKTGDELGDSMSGKSMSKDDAAKNKAEEAGDSTTAHGFDGDDDDDAEYDAEEPPEDDDMPPLAEEPSAGLQAAEIQRIHSHSHSRASSTLSRAPTIVPRSKRRGLFGRLAVLPEVERPYEYPRKTKWLITLVISLSAAAGPMGSSIFYPALSELAADLNVTSTLANLTVAMYMLAMSIFPLWWSSFSETFGRRTIYIVSFTLFVVFSILSAVSHSIGMLIVMRVLSGGASASVQAVGAGTLADIWQPHERGRAMGIFYLGPLTGPLLAPIIGGALSEAWGWQSTMWFLAIFGGLSLAMLFFCLPETLSRNRNHGGAGGAAGSGAGAGAGSAAIVSPLPPPGTADSAATANPLARIRTTQSVRARTQRVAVFLKHAFVHPLSVLLYLRFPPIILTVVYGSVTFGALFILNVSLQSAYGSPPYGFSEIIVGLLYIPGGLGYIMAAMVGGRWIDRIMAREARRAGRFDADGQLQYLPEDRMRENAWLAASLYPAAMIWFGWTVQNGILWVAPAIANFIFGFGSMLVFGAVTTMLTEFMPRRSSGGIALNNFLRNIFSCVGVVVAQPLINAMGYGWLCTMVALLSWVVGNACIWALRRYSGRWRVEMDAKLNKLL